MIYVALLVFGFISLVVMALMGSVRTGSHHGAGRLGHARAPVGARSGPGRALPKGGARGHHAAQAHGARGPSRLSRNASWLLQGLSPIDVLAMAMGAGALGIVGRKVLHNETTAAFMAIGGAIVMDLLIVRPLFTMLLRFASNPSSGLEGMISQMGEAVTSFDAHGRGLIKLSLDGQTSQVFARLDPDELASGVQVCKGDSLVVLEVDGPRNSCRVSREIASP